MDRFPCRHPRVAVLSLFLLSAGETLAQDVAEVYSKQIIVSPKGVEALPFASSGTATRSSAPGTAKALAVTAPITFTQSSLRDLSRAAGIYVAPTAGVVCVPGTICKTSTDQPEQINLVDVGPTGDVSRVLEVTSNSATALGNTLAALNAQANLEATPNYWRRHTQTLEPQYYLQWGWAARNFVAGGANFTAAWARTRGSANVVVAVVDTGVVPTHPDIGPALLPGIDLVVEPLLAGDGNGADLDASDPGNFVDANLQNFMRGRGVSCSAVASNWHGTHVAGTVAAQVNGQFGTGGAPSVRVLPVRVLGKCGGEDRSIYDGVAWAMGLQVQGLPLNPNPAQVINMSLGGPTACPTHYRRLFAEARRRNIIVVVAAGNDNRDTAGYMPAGCPDVISVAAHDRNAFKANFSNYGSNVLVSAPGVDVLSSVDLGNSFPIGPTAKEYNGTSMAAPHVAAAVALVKSMKPTATYDEVVQALRRSAVAFRSGSGCAAGEQFANQCGSGTLDTNTLLSAFDTTSPPPPPSSNPPATTEDSGDTGCFIATAAYGTPMAQEVQVLREFRDRVLLSTALGKQVVRWYYDTSPPVADFIRTSDTLRAVTRGALMPVLWSVQKPLQVLAILVIMLTGLLTTALMWRRKLGGK